MKNNTKKGQIGRFFEYLICCLKSITKFLSSLVHKHFESITLNDTSKKGLYELELCTYQITKLKQLCWESYANIIYLLIKMAI
jgi:hypothetical protein